VSHTKEFWNETTSCSCSICLVKSPIV